MDVLLLDAPASSGKTTGSILDEIALHVRLGDRVLLLQPTRALIDETAAHLRRQFPAIPCRVIYGDEGVSAVNRIVAYLAQPLPGPHVFIITFEAYQRLRFFPGKASWHLIVDEIPQAFHCFDEPLFKSHGRITAHVKASQLENSRYGILAPTNDGALRAIAENKSKDRVVSVFQPLASDLNSPHWVSYVDMESYGRLLASKKESQRLTVFSMMKPSMFEGFASVMIAGACFRESILFHSFQRQDVNFVEASRAQNSLQFTEHKNGAHLTILCATQERWSKNFRDMNDRKALKEIVKAVKNEFGDARFIWAANKDIDSNLFGKERRDDRLSNAPHGLNCWRHVDNAVFLSAHNLTPAQGRFMQERLGLTAEQIGTAIHRQVAYQAIMRCSLRDQENTNPKRVFVPDHATAQWLQGKFPGASLRFLDIGLKRDSAPRGRPKIHASGAARVAAYRKRKAALKQDMEKLQAKFIKTSDSLFRFSASDTCNENTIKRGNNVTNSDFDSSQFRVSVFMNKTAKDPLGFVFDTLEGFESNLEISHERVVATKDAIHLFSPAYFDASKSKTTARGNENVLFAAGLWLDFDGGDLAPDDFAMLFPTLRMTAFNSFSSTKSALRYRVYIPTTTIITGDVYRKVTHQILAKIVEAGYPLAKPIAGDSRKVHGLDTGKIGPASLFYQPCQPKDPSGRYFKIFKDDARDPLNAVEWINELDIPDFDPVVETSPPSERRPESGRVENAIRLWQENGCSPGSGNAEFFKLATRLANAGLSEFDVGKILVEQAHFAHTPHDRITDISRILKQLQREGKFAPVQVLKGVRGGG